MLEDIKLELHQLLYSDTKVDELLLKKQLYLLLKECIKEREYEIQIGSYEFNITPQNLSVKYITDNTTVEVSNDDVYYESTRDTETRFFCISQVHKSEFLMDTPLIRVTGTVSNIDGICEEHYLFELYTDIFVLYPASLTRFIIFTSPLAISGTSNSNNFRTKLALLLDN